MSTASDERPAMLVPLVLVLGHTLAAAAWLAYLLLVVPDAERMFIDFQMKVPVLTEQVVELSRSLQASWLIAALLLVTAVSADAFILCKVYAASRLPAHLLSFVVFLALGAAFFLTWQAIALPLAQLRAGLAR